jgi:hypothetical protein
MEKEKIATPTQAIDRAAELISRWSGFFISNREAESMKQMILNLKKELLILVFLALSPVMAIAQCTIATPCVAVNWTNTSMAATLATNSAGVETSGPGTAAVYRCIGSASACSAASLTASNCSSGTCAAGSPWSILSNTIAQAAAAGNYTDPAISYGETVNYAITNTWSGSQGGVASGYSGIFQLAIGAAPSASPAAPATPTGVLVTSGS